MDIEKLRSKKAFISDMDGVIYHGNKLLPDVKEFVQWLRDNQKKFLFLTNSSERSPRELSQKLNRLGIDVSEENFYTSALSTATFLGKQCPGGSAYVIGEPALTGALYDVGFTMNDVDPDYVVCGETHNYNYDKMIKACQLVRAGAKLIGTNPDINGPAESGIIPACGSLIEPIAKASECQPYFVGKPNPLMMRHALKKISCTREETAIIGDRMDTDIIAGVESEIETVLVLSGVAQRSDLFRFPYQPGYVFDGVGNIFK
jgi:NagD protein